MFTWVTNRRERAAEEKRIKEREGIEDRRAKEQQEIEDRRAKEQRAIDSERAREAALQTYLDQLTELIQQCYQWRRMDQLPIQHSWLSLSHALLLHSSSQFFDHPHQFDKFQFCKACCNQEHC